MVTVICNLCCWIVINIGAAIPEDDVMKIYRECTQNIVSTIFTPI